MDESFSMVRAVVHLSPFSMMAKVAAAPFSTLKDDSSLLMSLMRISAVLPVLLSPMMRSRCVFWLSSVIENAAILDAMKSEPKLKPTVCGGTWGSVSGLSPEQATTAKITAKATPYLNLSIVQGIINFLGYMLHCDKRECWAKCPLSVKDIVLNFAKSLKT